MQKHTHCNDTAKHTHDYNWLSYDQESAESSSVISVLGNLQLLEDELPVSDRHAEDLFKAFYNKIIETCTSQFMSHSVFFFLPSLLHSFELPVPPVP